MTTSCGDHPILVFAAIVATSIIYHKSIRPRVNVPRKLCKIFIHGGAGTIDKRSTNSEIYIAALQNILFKSKLFATSDNNSKSALDIAEYAVALLEDEELFNAGKGSVFTTNEEIEMEASIMDGKTLACGACSMVKHVKNPIKVARKIMTETVHQYIVGCENVEKLAKSYKLEMFEQGNQSYFKTIHRWNQLQNAKKINATLLDLPSAHAPPNKTALQLDSTKGTVGCVVVKDGNVASATSTGGMSNKMSGRVGDTPLIGAGTYADNSTAAVSCTGWGEVFMRHVVAFDVCARMKYGGKTLQQAVNGIICDVLEVDSGGLIAVTPSGDHAFAFNTPGMFRGFCDCDSYFAQVGIWEDTITYNMNEFVRVDEKC